MSSAATLLFEQIGEGIAAQTFIEKMISDKRLENEHLDYKVASRIPESDIKKHWSKALSAFANTGGGVLLWGVDCRKVKQSTSVYEIDEPTGTSLHPNATALAQQLSEFLHAATEDSVEGVQIRPVPFDGGDSGCVVCLIPEGKNKPYRAKFVDEKYFMRAPDRMEVIPHSLLRSLFYPRPKAKLTLTVAASNRNEGIYDFRVTAKNDGAVTAKDVVIVTTLLPQMTIKEPWYDSWKVVGNEGLCGVFRFSALQSIHSGFTLDLSTFRVKGTLTQLLQRSPYTFTFEIFIQDQEASTVSTQFTTQEIDGVAIPVSHVAG